MSLKLIAVYLLALAIHNHRTPPQNNRGLEEREERRFLMIKRAGRTSNRREGFFRSGDVGVGTGGGRVVE